MFLRPGLLGSDMRVIGVTGIATNSFCDGFITFSFVILVCGLSEFKASFGWLSCPQRSVIFLAVDIKWQVNSPFCPGVITFLPEDSLIAIV